MLCFVSVSLRVLCVLLFQVIESRRQDLHLQKPRLSTGRLCYSSKLTSALVGPVGYLSVAGSVCNRMPVQATGIKWCPRQVLHLHCPRPERGDSFFGLRGQKLLPHRQPHDKRQADAKHKRANQCDNQHDYPHGSVDSHKVGPV